ncbi:hypothetical protein PAPHI01_0024 [Pancytospora philotis]|nr:hypothetical protein PAPHI01_0024 [Pancytospora philotis]
MIDLLNLREPGLAVHSDFSVIYRISRLHLSHTRQEIQELYDRHYGTAVEFPGGHATTLSRLFAQFSGPADALDDTSCAYMLAHEFVSINNLPYVLGALCRDEVDAFNRYMAREHATQEAKLLPGSPRAVQLVNQGFLSPWVVHIEQPQELVLSGHTFHFLVQSSVSLAVLFAYEPSAEELDALLEALAAQPAFRTRCTKFLRAQGVTSKTALVVSEALGLGIRWKHPDARLVCDALCSKHSRSVFVPCTAFMSGDLLINCMAYLDYLRGRDTIEHDIPEVLLFFEYAHAAKEQCADGTLACDAAEKRAAPEHCCTASVPPASLYSFDTLTSLSYARDKDADEPDSAEAVLLAIADAVFKCKRDVSFHPLLFGYLPKLCDRDYYDEVCELHRATIGEAVPASAAHSVNEGWSCTPASFYGLPSASVDPCEEPSLDSFDTNALLSSAAENTALGEGEAPALLPSDGEPHTALPTNAVLPPYQRMCQEEASRLLEQNIQMQPVSELVSLFLCVEDPPAAVIQFFSRHLHDIRNSVDRGLVMCKLALPVPRGCFKATALNTILARTKNPYCLREAVLHDDVTGRNVDRFLACLTDDQSADIQQAVLCSAVSEGFAIGYIRYITRKYEFLHIHDLLVHFADRYGEPVILEIQEAVIALLTGMFVTEVHIERIAVLYKKAMRLPSRAVKVSNERILTLILACGKAANLDLLIGNVKSRREDTKENHSPQPLD